MGSAKASGAAKPVLPRVKRCCHCGCSASTRTTLVRVLVVVSWAAIIRKTAWLTTPPSLKSNPASVLGLGPPGEQVFVPWRVYRHALGQNSAPNAGARPNLSIRQEGQIERNKATLVCTMSTKSAASRWQLFQGFAHEHLGGPSPSVRPLTSFRKRHRLPAAARSPGCDPPRPA